MVNLLILIFRFLEKFPDAKRAEVHLDKFSKQNDQRSYRLMRLMMDPSADHKAILRTGVS